jgi:monovalent cation:H+ antiporter-2, CPA2 family
MDQQITDLTGIAVVASVAVISGLALIRLRQPAIVGYILAGVLLGPSGLALVSRTEGLITLAELGVLMLLFLIAMELSIRAFVTVLRTALLCALLQIALALALTFLLALLMNWPVKTAVLLGFIVSLSSTAVAIKMLEDIGELRTHIGRITVGVLIAQDLAVVPMLIVAGAMAGEGHFTYIVAIKVAVSVALLAALIWYLSRRQRVALPIQRLMRGKTDVIPLAALAFCFAAAAVSASIGLSAAYGAFLAGLLIGNSAVRAVTLRATLPIQSVLMVVFFLSIGLLLDLRYVWQELPTVLALLLSVVVVKTVSNVAYLRLLGEPWERAFPAGLVMGQIGEFSFVLSAIGAGGGLLSPDDYRLAIAVIALSLLASPLWLISVRRFHHVTAGGILSMREALREVYGTEISTAARIGAFLRHVARVAAALLSRRG